MPYSSASLVRRLPHRAPPPSVTSGDFARRELMDLRVGNRRCDCGK